MRKLCRIDIDRGDFKERFLDRADSIFELTDLPIEPYTENEFDNMKRQDNPFVKEILKGKLLFNSEQVIYHGAHKQSSLTNIL